MSDLCENHTYRVILSEISEVPHSPHILTQLGEIYRLVYDLTIFDEIFLTIFFLNFEKLPKVYLSGLGQIVHQMIDLAKLSKNMRDFWLF